MCVCVCVDVGAILNEKTNFNLRLGYWIHGCNLGNLKKQRARRFQKSRQKQHPRPPAGRHPPYIHRDTDSYPAHCPPHTPEPTAAHIKNKIKVVEFLVIGEWEQELPWPLLALCGAEPLVAGAGLGLVDARRARPEGRRKVLRAPRQRVVLLHDAERRRHRRVGGRPRGRRR